MNQIVPPHGGNLEHFRERYPEREWVDFSANINPLGIPRPVITALADSAADCCRYPDPDCNRLRRAIARAEGVAPEEVLCGNGASDLIWRIALGLRPRRAMVTAPTFSEYERALEAAGCAVERHLLRPEKGFAPDGSLLEAVRGVDLVFLCSPNNPTGLLPDPELLGALCRRDDLVVVVDECFLDFVQRPDAYSCKKYLSERGKLIILRAYTKLFAIPGARMGYCISRNAPLLAAVEGAGPVWNVSVPAQAAGIACAQQEAFVCKTRRFVAERRGELALGLASMDLEVSPGEANFLLFRSRRHDLAERLCEMGVLIRDCRNFTGLGTGYYRVAVRGAEENSVLLEALRAALGSGMESR